jgi:putative ABC transport system permease protein
VRFLKRALLSLLYYWKTGVLLVVLFTVIATLLLSGICVKDAAQKETAAIRRSLGGAVTLSGPLDAMGNVSKLLTLSQVTTIAKLPQVHSAVYVVSCKAKPQSLKAVNTGALYGAGDLLLVGVNNSALQEKFTQGDDVLKSGRQLTEKDLSTSNTVISQNFAALNHLALGDSVPVVSGKMKVSLKIVGIYAPKKSNVNRDDNSLYVPYPIVFHASNMNGFFHAVFTMNDPIEIDTFQSKVLSLGYGFKASQMDASDFAYSQLSGPINSLSSIAYIMVIIMLIAGAAIFCLIILLGLRGRKYEIGVLLSIGEKKHHIIAQLALESLIPILIAFSISIGVGKLSAQSIGNTMFSAQTGGQLQTVSANDLTYKAPDKITVQVSANDAAFLYLSGLLIAVISITASSVLIMRYHPKDILVQSE